MTSPKPSQFHQIPRDLLSHGPRVWGSALLLLWCSGCPLGTQTSPSKLLQIGHKESLQIKMTVNQVDLSFSSVGNWGVGVGGGETLYTNWHRKWSTVPPGHFRANWSHPDPPVTGAALHLSFTMAIVKSIQEWVHLLWVFMQRHELVLS